MGSKKSNDGDKKSKKNKGIAPPARDSKGGGSGIIADPRFASVHSDPRFQEVPRHKAKVEVDSRFDRIFTDPDFGGSSAPVDKRGRPKKTKSENFLKEYYRIKEKRAREEEEQEPEFEEEKKSEESDTESSDESVESDFDGLDSDTSSDGDEGVVYRLEDDEPEAPEENVPEIEEETRRLAVVNMDWRHVKASDLYVMLSSFLPESGQILSVAVYPSEFGLKRMKEEELHGPVGLFDDETAKSNDDEEDNDEDEEIDNEKLRAYEKSKLRYYYAVMECDSVATADHLYKACDGVELARSSNVLDLRFIPDSMEFKHPPRDVATEAPSKYEGLNFQTQALQHSKIHLSWDDDEPERAKTLKRKLNAEQLEELELKEYLASEESESDEDDGDAIEDNTEKKQKKRDLYKALLNSGNNSDGDAEEDDDAQNMEVTFNAGLEEQSKIFLEKNKKQETVWEAHLRARREKKKLRKNRSKDSSDDESSDDDQVAVEEPGDFFVDEPSVEKHKKPEGKRSKRAKREEDPDRQAEATEAELELLLADDNVANTGLKGYNLKPKKVKGKGGKKVKKTLEEDEIPPIIDDPRFSMIFTSTEFAMDPTDPQFIRTATYARQVALRKQKHNEEFAERSYPVPAEPQVIVEEQAKSDDRSSNKKKYELLTDIRSVKMRCQQIKPHSDEKAESQTRDGASKSAEKKDKIKKIRDHDLASMLQSVKRHSLSKKKR